jgi:hypothetical protein
MVRSAGLAMMPESAFLEFGQHFEQGRLAGAVGSTEADTIPVADLPGDAIEERAIAEGLGQFAELNHAAGVSAGRFEVKALLGCS